MTRPVLRAAACMLAAGAAACAPHDPQPTLTQLTGSVETAGLLPSAGAVYRDRMPFLGRDMPLPPGEWRLLSVSNLVAKGRIGLSQVFMEQHQGSTVAQVLSVVGVAPGVAGPTVSLQGACQAGDVIDNRIRAADPTGEQDCLTVNFGLTSVMRANFARTPANAPAQAFLATAFTNMFGQLDARNLVLPPTVVEGSVALAHHGEAASVIVFYNPDLDRVPPDPAPLRSTNGWARFNLDRDPAKKAYVARVLSEMEAYRLRLIDMLDKPAQSPDAPKLRSTSLPARGRE